jgi:hypothetical protein
MAMDADDWLLALAIGTLTVAVVLIVILLVILSG